MYSYFSTYPPNEKYSYIFSNYHYGDYPELHNHDFWEFAVIVKGSYEHTLNKKTDTLAKNTAVLLRPHLDSHYLISNSPDGTILNIRIYSSFVKDFCSSISSSFYDELMKNERMIFPLTEGQIKKIIDYTSFIKSNPSDTNKSSIFFLASYIFEKVFSQYNFLNSEQPQWLTNLFLKIYSPENINWTVKDVVNNTPFSQSHLIRLFKQYTGKTLVEYLTEIKMQRACELLTYTNGSILSIAMMLGYSDSSHLNRTFKKYYGLSPTQYKKKSKQNAK